MLPLLLSRRDPGSRSVTVRRAARGGEYHRTAERVIAWLDMGDFGAVRRHKDGRYFVELPSQGGRKRRIWSQPVPGGHMPWTKDTAGRALELIRARIAQGATIDEALATFLSTSHEVHLVLARAAQWLETKRREVEAGDRSPTYVRELERYMRPGGHFSFWDGWSIHEVNYASLEDWSHWLADRGLSPKTRWNILGAFHSFLGWLYRREEIQELPREYPWPKPTESAPAVLSWQAQQAVLLAIAEERRGIFLALALMGLRPGEAVALECGDYHDGWLTVSKARKGERLHAPIRSTKTGKPKRLRIPEELEEWISRHVPPEARLQGGRSSESRGAEEAPSPRGRGARRAFGVPGATPARKLAWRSGSTSAPSTVSRPTPRREACLSARSRPWTFFAQEEVRTRCGALKPRKKVPQNQRVNGGGGGNRTRLQEA